MTILEVLLLVSLALSPSGDNAANDGDLKALERTADELTKAKEYDQAARVWIEIAESESASDEERGLAVMRAIGTYRVAFDAHGDVQHLCDAHKILSSYLKRSESKEADYLRQFLPEIEAGLVDELGDTWHVRCDPNSDAGAGDRSNLRLVATPAPPPEHVEGPSTQVLDRVPTDSHSDFSEHRARGFVISGAVLTGSGASLLVVMAFAWSRAYDAANDIDAMIPEDGGLVSEEAVRDGEVLRDGGKPFEHLAIATAIAGGALVGAGVGLLVHGTKLRRRALTVSPHASLRGGGVNFQVRF